MYDCMQLPVSYLYPSHTSYLAHAHTQTHIRTHTETHTHTHTHAHAHAHTHTLTHTHTHAHIGLDQFWYVSEYISGANASIFCGIGISQIIKLC